MSMPCPSILFIIFNRPKYTKRAFAAIRKAKPSKLYIACDGARENVYGELEQVNESRKIATNVDWNCKVKTFFRKENSGNAGKSVEEAINWFYKNESEGIILEHDCVPNSSFFQFCAEMLEKYRNNMNVFGIVGYNPLGKYKGNKDYYFTQPMMLWGIAGWANRWLPFYSFSLKNYNRKYLKNFYPQDMVYEYWEHILDIMILRTETWDYQYIFQCVANNGLFIQSSKNLISNIGIDGIHFTPNMSKNSYYRKLLFTKTYKLQKLKHPEKIELNKSITKALAKKRINNFKYPDITLPKYAKNKQIYLWGTGYIGILILRVLEKKNYKISGFIDSNEHLQKKEFLDYMVFAPKTILQKFPNNEIFIVISTKKYAEEIKHILINNKLKENLDFWKS
jgi:hypothetical protein